MNIGAQLAFTGAKRLFTTPVDTVAMKETPESAPGFGQTALGKAHPVRTLQWQETPASGMGYVAPPDHHFAQTVGDYVDEIVSRKKHPAGKWNPLHKEQWFIEGSRQQEYEWDFLTAHSHLEQVRLHTPYHTRAPLARPYVLNFERPESRDLLARPHRGILIQNK